MIKLNNNDNNNYLIFYFNLKINNVILGEEFASKVLEGISLNINEYKEKERLISDLITIEEVFKDKVYVFLFDNFDNKNNKILFHYFINDIGTYPFNLVMYSYTKFINLDLVNIFLIFEKKLNT